ncbi:adenosylcobinamide-GDP ribazoletransferase [Actinopolymorpha sp. B17G11]|uniref:adenosylcobinamide-GDP ribazoletransferase n=1 Tax=Actinopolymorpha sp. B17G11 TaxID=3160861 RepID=UPI0032E3C498
MTVDQPAGGTPTDQPTAGAPRDQSERRDGWGFRTAVGLFTAIPVPRHAARHLDRQLAARALRWLPVVGAGLGLVAGVPLFASTVLAPYATGAVLGSALAVAVLALATRGLHLDGLADTVDGLGSAAPPAQALAIMRKPDIGAFGVLAIVLVVLIKVAALATVSTAYGAGVGVLALVAAEHSGRVAVVLAARTGVPSARPSGFGALVAGSADRTALLGVAVTTALLAAVPLVWGAPATSLRLLAGAAVGLAVAEVWRHRVVRRIGGVTGDVFGSIVELASVAVLLTIALSAGGR